MNRVIATIGLACAGAAAGWFALSASGQGVELPQAEIVTLCEANEAGDRIVFSGRVLDMDGLPLAKAAVVAYGADAQGHYAPPETGSRNPRLRGVAITDDQGRYAFETVYPGGYPGREDPSHVHLTVTAPMHGVKYVTFWFEGDPRLTPAKRRAIDRETVIVELGRLPDGRQAFTHDIRLRGS